MGRRRKEVNQDDEGQKTIAQEKGWQYGKRTRQAMEVAEADTSNVFGRAVFAVMAQKGYRIADILRATGLWIERFYRMVQAKEHAVSTDVEIIARLAWSLGLKPARLFALYLQTKQSYRSAEYRQMYRMEEVTGEELARYTAAFVWLWEALVHSPRLKKVSKSVQSEQLLRTAELAELFLQIDDAKQQVLLTMAESLVPRPDLSPIDKKARLLDQRFSEDGLQDEIDEPKPESH